MSLGGNRANTSTIRTRAPDCAVERSGINVSSATINAAPNGIMVSVARLVSAAISRMCSKLIDSDTNSRPGNAALEPEAATKKSA